MSLKFKAYSEIEDTYNEKNIAAIRDAGFDKLYSKWFCFNKIDGSNFQCSIDEDENFICGTRSNYLERDSDFQGWRRAMKNEDVENKLRKMKQVIFDNFFKDFPYKGVKTVNDFSITVYGELCGGFYRHPDVEKVKGAVKIQGRVDYHPDNMWVPFDILLRWNKKEKEEIQFLCEQTQVMKYCEEVGLPHEQVMFEGTLDECLKFPVEYTDTTGNFLWGLPIIENNISEGVVIKPDIATFFPNGQRVILKNKGTKFKERVMKNKEKQIKDYSLNDLEQKYYNIYREFITESRLYSVFSKVGQINDKSFGLLLGMFMKDLTEDFNKEYGDEIKKLECSLSMDEFNNSKIRKLLSKEVSGFIKPLFVKKINER